MFKTCGYRPRERIQEFEYYWTGRESYFAFVWLQPQSLNHAYRTSVIAMLGRLIAPMDPHGSPCRIVRSNLKDLHPCSCLSSVHNKAGARLWIICWYWASAQQRSEVVENLLILGQHLDSETMSGFLSLIRDVKWRYYVRGSEQPPSRIGGKITLMLPRWHSRNFAVRLRLVSGEIANIIPNGRISIYVATDFLQKC